MKQYTLYNFFKNHGWIKYKSEDNQGNYCLIGASYEINGKTFGKNYCKLEERLIKAIKKEKPKDTVGIADFNDYVLKTKNQLMKFLLEYHL